MKTSELIAVLATRLAEHGDMEVMMTEPNDGSTYSIGSATFKTTKKGDYDPSWHMPRKFINIRNY